jgi:hypothetical protein
MTAEKTDLSRRRILGSIATLGGAAALGGAGSIAFLSDRERFANNRLVAGELDLKVGWQEHYSDWSPDESDGIETVRMEPGDGLTGFPGAAPEAEQAVFVSDPGRFLQNTAIEAYPDVLEPEETYDALKRRPDDDSDICDLGADTPEVLASGLRTRGTFPRDVPESEQGNPQTTEPGDPLVAIQDVKPGDFGEVTFSFHVCGNPAFVWLTGALRDASENGTNESERKDPDEEEGVVELLDEIRAAFWYDTGSDGVYGADFADKDAGEGDNDRQSGELIALSGTLRSVLTALGSEMLPLDAEPVSVDEAAGGDDGGSGADLADEVYVTTQDEEFTRSDKPGAGTARNYQCADYEDLLEVGSIVGTEIIDTDAFQVGASFTGCTTVTVTAYDPNRGTVGLSSSDPVKVVSVKGGPVGEQVYVFDSPVVLDGVEFTTPGDFGISNVDVCCPADGDGGGGQADDDRECFENSTTAYVGFEWWLPVDHANEIQSDSVSFDLGFYTEQCRHNDGSGRMGNDGGGQDDDDDDGGDEQNGVEGDGAISFLAACVETGREVSAEAARFRVTDVLDSDDEGEPTAVAWASDVDLDSVTAFYGSSTEPQGPKFTTYIFETPQGSGTVVTGADADGTIAAGDEDGSPETTPFSKGKNKPSDEDQTPDEPCPDGYTLVEKVDESAF